MSLRHIILGLTGEPTSGYEIKQELVQSLSHFWAAELSQIYPALRALEQEGLLSSRPAPSDKGPPKKLYRRTAAGTRVLAEWFSDGPRLQEERRHYLAQVFFLDGAKDPAVALDFFQQLRVAMEARLDRLEAIEREWAACDPRYPDQLPDSEIYRQMTLDLGKRIFRVNVEWCRSCIDRLNRRLHNTPVSNA